MHQKISPQKQQQVETNTSQLAKDRCKSGKPNTIGYSII